MVNLRLDSGNKEEKCEVLKAEFCRIKLLEH